MQTMVPTHVWQRRTHRIIAMAVIIIGLTMMISTIPQCIYIGLIFIMLSLGWLAWMRMKDKKAEPPTPNSHPHATVSPVLFLVASQNFTQRQGVPTAADPNDKPPSYDQIVKLDGLPPDYFTILTAKPPRYEDIENFGKVWQASEDIPSVHACCFAEPGATNSGISISRSSSNLSTMENCSASGHTSFNTTTINIPSEEDDHLEKEFNKSISNTKFQDGDKQSCAPEKSCPNEREDC